MMMLGKYHNLVKQFLKYVLVGGTAFVFDFSTLYLLTEYADLYYLLSAAIAFIVGLNVNYFVAKRFVFRESKIANVRAEYAFVAFVSFTGLLLNQGLIWTFTEIVGLYYLLSKVVASAIILVYNFVVRKIYIFK